MIRSLLHLFYPHTCEACGRDLSAREEILCLRCAYALPVTGFQHMPDNPVEKAFHGRIALRRASAGYFFRQHSRLQGLIHAFKYKGRQDIAMYLGRQLGLQLRQSDWWQQVSLVLPVPLNAAKQRHRGYNQAAVLAEGIAAVLGCGSKPDVLARSPLSSTQTTRSRLERWENVSTVFLLKDATAIANKHVLLVDDVLTTGATVEACAQALMSAGNVEVSVCSLAYTGK